MQGAEYHIQIFTSYKRIQEDYKKRVRQLEDYINYYNYTFIIEKYYELVITVKIREDFDSFIL